MKSNILICLIFGLFTLQSFGQDQIKSLNFILLIDGEVPVATISEGFFLFKDSSNTIIEKIPFTYKVGRLDFNNMDFEKLSSLASKYIMYVEFIHREPDPPFTKRNYQSSIWLNKDWIIMKIYNRHHNKRFDVYDFGDKTYIIQIESSTWNTVPRNRKKGYKTNIKREMR